MQISNKFSTLLNSTGNFRMLKIVAVLVPVLFILILEIARYEFFRETDPLITGGLILALAIISAIFFSWFIFSNIAREQEDTLNRNRELAVLNEIALTVNESLDLNKMLPQTMQKLIHLVKADSGDLFLINEKSRELWYTFHAGISAGSASETGLLTKEGLMGTVAQSDEVVIIQDLKKSRSAFAVALAAAGFGSLAVVPLKLENNNTGIIGLLSLNSNQFKLYDSYLFQDISHFIAVAIENSRRYEKVQAMAVAEERERISKELHDGLAQVLGFVITKSQATRQILRKISMANDYLIELENVAQDVYTDTREDILGLRTAVSGDRDMVSALREYLKRFSQMHGIKTLLEIGDEVIPSISPQVELQVIRIMQEALSNVRKHAEATQAVVKVAARGNEVVLEIKDDGKGFDVSKLGQNDFAKFGIRTSRERAESIQGRLDIESSPEQGTKVTLNIPLNLPSSSTEKCGEIESPNS